jgi:secondary thiamine-phosphate synthase enzyme
MATQFNILLPAYKRGFHLITKEIESQIGKLPTTGVLHLFIQHTSAGLTINENADPSVRHDLAKFTDKLIPECDPVYTHIFEGDDDMPAHIKASFYGSSVSIPIQHGKLALGTWQGIYLCEFRNHGGNRKLLATIIE